MPAIAPQAPTMASQGLTSTCGSGSIGRAPSLSSRMKQSCMLRKLDLLAPRSGRGRRTAARAPMERSRTSGCSILLNQPMNCVSSRRGMRFVSRKLRSSCGTGAARDRSVMELLNRCDRTRIRWHSAARHWRSTASASRRWPPSLREAEAAAGAVARQASLARRATRAWRAGSPRSCPVLRIRRGAVLRPTTRRRRSPRAAAPASSGSPRSTRSAFRRPSAPPPRSADGISDLQFTDAYRVPFQFSRLVREHLQAGTLRAVVRRRDAHRSRRQPLLRPDRLLRRQPVSATTSTRTAWSAASPACRSSGRCSARITR